MLDFRNYVGWLRDMVSKLNNKIRLLGFTSLNLTYQKWPKQRAEHNQSNSGSIQFWFF